MVYAWELLEKLQDKYSVLLGNYKFLKLFFDSYGQELFSKLGKGLLTPQDEEALNFIKNVEGSLSFNEKEKSAFVAKLLVEQLFKDVKNQAPAGNNNSQDNREIGSLDDDEKGPNLWEIEKKQQESNNTQNSTCRVLRCKGTKRDIEFYERL